MSDLKEDIYIAERNRFINAAPSFISPGEKDPVCPSAVAVLRALRGGEGRAPPPAEAPELANFSDFANSINMHKQTYPHKQC